VSPPGRFLYWGMALFQWNCFCTKNYFIVALIRLMYW
jgi:hypothetical protein